MDGVMSSRRVTYDSEQRCKKCDRDYMVKGCKSVEDGKNGWIVMGSNRV